MKKIFFFLFISLAIAGSASAQWSVGARLGGSTGVSLKKYTDSRHTAFEVITGFNFDDKIEGFMVSPMFEKMGPLTESGNFSAFLGPGVNMIFGDEFYFGASAILGLDWRLGKIGLQVDWMPTYIFVNESYFSPVNAAFTARLLFGHRRK
jgi:hypothetical protein